MSANIEDQDAGCDPGTQLFSETFFEEPTRLQDEVST